MTPSGYNITELLHLELWVSCFLRSFVSGWAADIGKFNCLDPKHPPALTSGHSQVHKGGD